MRVQFEQLKKQKSKKAGGKKNKDKDEAAAAAASSEDAAAAEAVEPTDSTEAAAPESNDKEDAKEQDGGDGGDGGDGDGDEAEKTTSTSQAPASAPAPAPSPEPSSHARKTSISLQSRQRSESFRQAGGTRSPPTGNPTLPPISAEDEVQELYRKQHSRIEELEKENKALKEAQEGDRNRLTKLEEELEGLREGSADVAELRAGAKIAEERAKEIDGLVRCSLSTQTTAKKGRRTNTTNEQQKSEITSLQRQLAQAQQQSNSNSNSRHKSNASPSREITEQLAQKTSTIESLELELSNLRNQYQISQSTNNASQATIAELEQRVSAAEISAASVKQEIETLKESLAKSSSTSAENGQGKEGEDVGQLQQNISTLESSLRTATTEAETAASRATALEQKIEALTRLHKDVAASNSAKEKEITQLKTRLNDPSSQKAKTKSGTTGDADADVDDTLSDLEDEEREALRTKIRDLEAENFDLRRGVWREKRQALQPGLEDDGGNGASSVSPTYEDVDLSAAMSGNPYAGAGGARPRMGSGGGRAGSTFQDVLQSGISAFTGRKNSHSHSHSYHQQQHADLPLQSAGGRGRGQSFGLLSEDGFDAFDEDAFRAAQEEEGKKRIERIRETKRGLEQWRGWRVDLVDLRHGGLTGGAGWTGPVFDV